MSTLAKFIGTLSLLFYYVVLSTGNVVSYESEVPPSMSCEHRYDTQPAQRALSCNALTTVVLQCQVTNDRNDFSISWLYSIIEPNSSNIHTAKYVHGFSNGNISTEQNVTLN